MAGSTRRRSMTTRRIQTPTFRKPDNNGPASSQPITISKLGGLTRQAANKLPASARCEKPLPMGPSLTAAEPDSLFGADAEPRTQVAHDSEVDGIAMTKKPESSERYGLVVVPEEVPRASRGNGVAEVHCQTSRPGANSPKWTRSASTRAATATASKVVADVVAAPALDRCGIRKAALAARRNAQHPAKLK